MGPGDRSSADGRMLLRPRVLCDEIADDLRARILRRDLLPGQKVDEAALAADYHVSRTPLREALRLLCHEGLLTARARRGMLVAVVGPDEVREARELLDVLRAHAASRPVAASRPAPPASLLSHLIQLGERRLELGGERRPGRAAPARSGRPAG